MNLFTCEINKNVAFLQPPEGTGMACQSNIYLALELSTLFESTFLEQYIMSPNYPDHYPNNYEEVK